MKNLREHKYNGLCVCVNINEHFQWARSRGARVSGSRLPPLDTRGSGGAEYWAVGAHCFARLRTAPATVPPGGRPYMDFNHVMPQSVVVFYTDLHCLFSTQAPGVREPCHISFSVTHLQVRSPCFSSVDFTAGPDVDSAGSPTPSTRMQDAGVSSAKSIFAGINRTIISLLRSPPPLTPVLDSPERPDQSQTRRPLSLTFGIRMP